MLAAKGGDKLVALTAYHALSASLADPHCDILLVGDSLGNVLYGFESTLPVTLDMMIAHGRAVVGASDYALVVIDMPFESYEQSKEQAFASAARVMRETGCGAVKLEGGSHFAETIAFLTARGIPVMAHIGLTPQSIHTLGSFRAQGRDEAAALSRSNTPGPIEMDAEAVAAAGAFAVVIEAVVEPLARHISAKVAIPTIGIGASPACDGQILVLEDMLGMTERTARFVERFADVRSTMNAGIAAFSSAVRNGSFPKNGNLYGVKA
ncbi:3-methyl-2-oxobutanoate hydroxymethyltransferase [Novosphingobium colocasiae]|uniref:3-methyl-2-oxobutanoate hydroxymethyltransferase n=1 Tax=Novosphingobium colocasiae TaxID=1256513 RepID=A0A918UH26_9SPHN|nr:3-methyl-2-oxobutanoate hydroxymethyltransferase [Novosphingobium colocasiae]GGZ07100.1 3-methyl-2-oxobutanoate hydroxymethyltransferase 3 [Novosphingobium colocasiae]